MPSKKSGGKRAVEKKHLQRDAARGDNFEANLKRRLRKLGKPASSRPDAVFLWLAKVGQFLITEALADIGIPPEMRREQAIRCLSPLVKALEPARLAEKLAVYEEKIAELAHAAQERSESDG